MTSEEGGAALHEMRGGRCFAGEDRGPEEWIKAGWGEERQASKTEKQVLQRKRTRRETSGSEQ